MGELGPACKMALRNVIAYRRRSLLAGSVVCAGVLAMCLADAYLNGFGDRLVADFAASGGHLRLSAPGYAARRALCALDRLVAEPEASAALAARAAAPAAISALPLIRVACVAQLGERSANLVALGAECYGPDGSLAPPFAASALAWGGYPRPGERGLLLSAKEARRLAAGPGDSLVLLASDAYGSFSAVELPLLGVAATAPGPEDCLVELGAMRELTGLESGATELALYVMGASGAPLDPRDAAAPIEGMAAAARAGGLEAKAWDASSSALPALLRFFDLFVYVIYAIFALVAGSGIANSVYLSVQDRLRDFATLRAVAFGPGALKAIVGLETLVVGAAGSAAGVAASYALIFLLGPGGFKLSRAMRGIAAWMPAAIEARPDPASLALIAAGGCLLPLIAAAYPLAVLGRLKIREALTVD